MILKLEITNKLINETIKKYQNPETVNGFGYESNGKEIAILSNYTKQGLIKTKLYIYENDKLVIAKYR